jgi:DnaJ-class molecular chaperone
MNPTSTAHQVTTALPPDTQIRCPVCLGKGEVNALTNFDPRATRNERVACIPCNGRGFTTIGKLRRRVDHRRPW